MRVINVCIHPFIREGFQLQHLDGIIAVKCLLVYIGPFCSIPLPTILPPPRTSPGLHPHQPSLPPPPFPRPTDSPPHLRIQTPHSPRQKPKQSPPRQLFETAEPPLSKARNEKEKYHHRRSFYERRGWGMMFS